MWAIKINSTRLRRCVKRQCRSSDPARSFSDYFEEEKKNFLKFKMFDQVLNLRRGKDLFGYGTVKFTGIVMCKF